MSEGFEYKVFISYSHADRKEGAWLHRKLTGYKVPKRALSDKINIGANRKIGRVFRDRDELATSHNLTAEVTKALNASEYMIVLCSPNAAASRWVNKEIIEFKKLRGEEYVHAIIIDGEPGASAGPTPELECFPPALRHKILADGSLSTAPAEVAAADIRPEADGRATAFLKILAGITGIELATLIDRDAKRTFWNVIKVTALSFMAMLAMGYATYEAIRAQREADFQKAEAEGIVDFMLGDLRGELDAAGRLSAFAAVGEKVLTYYEKQPLEAMTDASIGRRSSAFHLMGEVQKNLGNAEEALKYFEAAAQATEAALDRNPDNPQRIFDHAQSVFWVGDTGWSNGDIDKVDANWREYLRLAQRLIEIEPDMVRSDVELGYAYSNMGRLTFEGRSKPEEARGYFNLALSSFQDALEHEPNSAFYKSRADVNQRVWRYQDALLHVQRQIEILETQLVSDPGNKRFENTLGRAKNRYGRYSYLLSGSALKDQYRAAIEIAKVVHSHDKNNRFWQASLLAPLVDYAKQNIASGDWEEAASYVEQIDKLLNSVNASRQEFRWSTREFESELAILKGAVLIEQQQWLEAIEVLTNVIDKGSKLGTSGRLVVNLEDTAEAYYFRGQALDALGNKQTAQEDYLIAADFYRQLKFIDPLKSIDLMRLFEKTGRREDAEAIRERLFNSGISPQIYK